jgi:hypothetical protein
MEACLRRFRCEPGFEARGSRTSEPTLHEFALNTIGGFICQCFVNVMRERQRCAVAACVEKRSSGALLRRNARSQQRACAQRHACDAREAGISSVCRAVFELRPRGWHVVARCDRCDKRMRNALKFAPQSTGELISQVAVTVHRRQLINHIGVIDHMNTKMILAALALSLSLVACAKKEAPAEAAQDAAAAASDAAGQASDAATDAAGAAGDAAAAAGDAAASAGEAAGETATDAAAAAGDAAAAAGEAAKTPAQ